jgi:hypothetical protein
MKPLTAIAVALLLSTGTSAQAAAVMFRIYTGDAAQGPNTFKLTAEVRGRFAFGLAAYGVQLVGNAAVPTGSILTVNNNTLRGFDIETVSPGGDPAPAGFTLLRSPDDNNAATGANAVSITGSQDTTDPTAHLIRGFGMEASNVAAKGLVGTFPEGSSWGNAGVPIPLPGPRPIVYPGEFEIARGTLAVVPGGGPAIDFIPIPTAVTGASVFTSATGIAVAPAVIVRSEAAFDLYLIPEPATLGMAGMAVLALASVHRRK